MPMTIWIIAIIAIVTFSCFVFAKLRTRLRARKLLKTRQKEFMDLIDEISVRGGAEVAKISYRAKMLVQNATDEGKIPAMRILMGSALLSCENQETKQLLFEAWRKLLVAEFMAKKSAPAKIIKGIQKIPMRSGSNKGEKY